MLCKLYVTQSPVAQHTIHIVRRTLSDVVVLVFVFNSVTYVSLFFMFMYSYCMYMHFYSYICIVFCFIVLFCVLFVCKCVLTNPTVFKLNCSYQYIYIYITYVKHLNRLKPNDLYMSRTAPLTSKRCILYIYSTNIGTEYFKHALYPPFFSLQNAVCFIMLTSLVPVLFTFYIQVALKLKKIIPAPKG